MMIVYPIGAVLWFAPDADPHEINRMGMMLHCVAGVQSVQLDRREKPQVMERALVLLLARSHRLALTEKVFLPVLRRAGYVRHAWIQEDFVFQAAFARRRDELVKELVTAHLDKPWLDSSLAMDAVDQNTYATAESWCVEAAARASLRRALGTVSAEASMHVAVQD